MSGPASSDLPPSTLRTDGPDIGPAGDERAAGPAGDVRAVGPAGDARGSGPAGDLPADGSADPVAGAGSADPAGRRRLGLDLAIYTGLRLGLIVAIAALLTVFLPLIVALFFAIILQLPLAWLLFGKQRRRVNEGVAVATAARRQHRQELRDALENGRD